MSGDDLLYEIFGEEVRHLSERDTYIAGKVLAYFDRIPITVPDISKRERDMLDACRYALEQEGLTWRGVMLTKTRLKEVVGCRMAIFSIFWKRVYATQERKTRLLGGVFDRVTIIHAIDAADDYREYDPSFRELYNRLLDSVNYYLAAGKPTSLDVE